MFRVFGVVNDYFKNRGNITDADLGRYNVTRKAADRHVFKVPSLRMAALTEPYLHDGGDRGVHQDAGWRVHGFITLKSRTVILGICQPADSSGCSVRNGFINGWVSDRFAAICQFEKFINKNYSLPRSCP